MRDRATPLARVFGDRGGKSRDAHAGETGTEIKTTILPAFARHDPHFVLTLPHAGGRGRQATRATPAHVMAIPAMESGVGTTWNIANSSTTAKIGVR